MLREVLARFGIKVDDRQLKKADGALKRFIGGLKSLGGMLAAGFVVRGLFNFVRGQIAAADVLGKTAMKLGVMTDELQFFRYAAGRAGVAQTTLDMGLQRFTRRAAEAAKGTGEAKDALRELGVDLRDSGGNVRSTRDLLGQVANGLANTRSQADRLRLGFKLFDSEGVALINLLKDGAESLDELEIEFRDLGGGIDESVVKMAETATDAFGNFRLSLTSLISDMLAQLLPTITRVVDKLIDWSIMVRKATENTNLWQAALLAIGATAAAVGIAMFVAFIKPILIIGLIAAAIFVVILAVDDLITFFEGGDSAFGRMLDSMFGEGTANAVRQWFRQLQYDLAIFMLNVEGHINYFVHKIAKAIVDVWLFVYTWFHKVRNAAVELGVDIRDAVLGAIGDVQNAFGRIAGFFGIEVEDATGRATAAAANRENAIANARQLVRLQEPSDIDSGRTFARLATAGPPGAPGASTGPMTVNQTNNVTIENRSGDPRTAAAEVRSAIGQANARTFRNAQRALTQVPE